MATETEANPRLMAALHYAAIGWAVVPLHTPDEHGVCDCHRPDAADPEKHPIGKHPRTQHGLDDATTDEAKIRRWWSIWPHANIAIDLAKAGLVDVAPDSLEWFAEFTAQGLPQTLRFASGGGEGHEHHLYARPEGCDTYRNTHTGEYDVLSAGYAVMPPSLHRSGRTYEWRDPAEGLPLMAPTTEAPAWVVGMLRRPQGPQTGRSADAGPDDGPPVTLHGEARERWYGRLYQRKADGSVDRSYSLWWLAVVLLEAGLRRTYVEQCLAERDVALGWTKFSGRRDAARRYAIIVDRALAGQGPGRASDHGPTAEPHVEPKTPPPPRPTWKTARELNESESEDITWRAYGLLGVGLLTELDGKAKQAGKTTFILDMLHAILYGEEFLGQATSYTPVVYLTEQSGPSFKRNLSRAGLLDRDDLHILAWNEARGMKWPDVVAEARVKAREVGADVIVIDTLAQFSGIRGDEENKSGAAMETVEPIQAAIADGLAVLVSRHDRKSGGEVGDSGRGSSAYAGLDDIILQLTRLPEEDKERQRLLKGTGRFSEETPDKLVIEWLPGSEGERSRYIAVGDAHEVRAEALKIDILASLRPGHDSAPTFEDLRKELGVREITLRGVLRALVKDGLVEGFGRPQRYCLPSPAGWADD